MSAMEFDYVIVGAGAGGCALAGVSPKIPASASAFSKREDPTKRPYSCAAGLCRRRADRAEHGAL